MDTNDLLFQNILTPQATIPLLFTIFPMIQRSCKIGVHQKRFFQIPSGSSSSNSRRKWQSNGYGSSI